MKKKKNNHGNNKNHAAANGYKYFIEKSPTAYGGTVESDNLMLSGSEIITSSEKLELNEDKPKSKPLRYILKDNLVSTIVSSLLVMFAGFIFNFIITTHSSIQTINRDLEYIEKSITTLENGTVNKENLQLQIENVKRDFENSIIFDMTNIKNKIEAIEKKLTAD